MKKIFCLMLAVICAFSLFACGDKTDEYEPIRTAIAATNPKTAQINTKYESTEVTLEGSFKITYTGEKSATIDYKYEKLGKIGESYIVTVEDTATYNDGSYSVEDAEVNGTVALAEGGIALNLDVSKLESPSIENNTFKATVKSANTESVLGVAVGSDVAITIVTNGTVVTSVTFTYKTASGANATVTCTYTV